MNVLLVYPKYPDTFWSFKHVLKFVSKKAAFPPLGLLTVSSLLPSHWKKRLVDVNVNELRAGDIAWADMVFVSAMIIQEDSAREIIHRCKAHGKRVVAGGPLFTTQDEKFECIDHFILGEAENIIKDFINDIKKGQAKKVYKSRTRPDISKTPLPDWSLINYKNYVTMPIQYSRGCPYDCEFCDIVIMNGRIPRTKTPQQMISEMQSLYDTGWRGSVFIVDDNFIGNKLNAKIMLTSLVRWQQHHNFPFKFLTEASLNLADDKELMQMMSAANFNKVFLGIETPCIESLTECNKKLNVNRDLAETVKTIQQNGMQVMAGFIVGFDSDTENIFEAQIKFIQQIGVATAMVGVLTALPQTRLWHRLKAEGRLLGKTTGGNTDGVLNFVPKMDKDQLMAGYKRLVNTIYSPSKYYQRVHTLIRNYKPTVKGRMKREDVDAFFKSMWKIGILSRARFYYWKLIIKTFFTKRKALSTAVELAIHGEHYKRVARKIGAGSI